jgi:hypothetical protein
MHDCSAHAVAQQALLQSNRVSFPTQRKHLNAEQATCIRQLYVANDCAKTHNQLCQSKAYFVAMSRVDPQRMRGRVQQDGRGRAGMHSRLASLHKALD